MEKDLRKYENLRRQQEAFTNMVETYKERVTQLNETLENLSKQPDDTVTYKAVGQVMFKVDKPALSTDLDDRQKTLEMRLASTKKQVESLTEKLTELQNKIQMELSKQNLRLQ